MSFLSSAQESYKKQTAKNFKKISQDLLGTLRGHLSAFGISGPFGSFGDIVFEVSSRHVLTYRDYKRTTKARYGSHEIIGQKPIIEYLGPDGEELSFSMQFRPELGVNPAEEADKVRKICETGKHDYLIIGNVVIGANPWVIASVSESAEIWDNMGRIIKSKIDVTLKEYVAKIET